MKLTQKEKLLTKTLSLLLQPYLMNFQIIYFISSLITLQFFTMTVCNYLAATVAMNRYHPLTSPKFQQLFFSFGKMLGYHTLPISWFINFKLLNIRVTMVTKALSVEYFCFHCLCIGLYILNHQTKMLYKSFITPLRTFPFTYILKKCLLLINKAP